MLALHYISANLCLTFCQLQSERVDDLIANSSSGSIYETVQTEVRRAILDIQNDLESVSICGFSREISLLVISLAIAYIFCLETKQASGVISVIFA